jgi:hypothetical protein
MIELGVMGNTANVNLAARALGSLGGKARAKNLSDEALKEIGQKGALARWGKPKPKPKSRGMKA